jgi:predicted dehydrogenase
MSEKDPIRYAVVGLGRAGWDIHVRQLRNRTDAKIVAVADPVAERREQAGTELGCRAHESLSKLLKQQHVEVVIVATPSAQHAADTIRALKAHKHVVVEKPMALGVAEADRMIRAANECGRKLFVHQNYRFFPEYLHMRDVISSGVLGKLFHIRAYVSSFSRRNDWQTLSRNGGGLLNNHGAHTFDQLLQLAPGRVSQVWGDLRKVVSAGDVEDHVKAMIRFDSGVTADVELSTAENIAIALPKWILCGSAGTLTLPADAKTSTLRWFDPAKMPALVVNDGPASGRKNGSGEQIPWQEKVHELPPKKDGAFYDNVAAVLRDDDEMVVTPESVRENLRVLALVRKGTGFPGKARKSPMPQWS